MVIIGISDLNQTKKMDIYDPGYEPDKDLSEKINKDAGRLKVKINENIDKEKRVKIEHPKDRPSIEPKHRIEHKKDRSVTPRIKIEHKQSSGISKIKIEHPKVNPELRPRTKIEHPKKLNGGQNKSTFIPSLTSSDEKGKREFTPSLEKNQETKKDFIPSLYPSNSKEKRSGFVPSLEKKEEIKKRDFVPKLTSSGKKIHSDFIPSLERLKTQKTNILVKDGPKQDGYPLKSVKVIDQISQLKIKRIKTLGNKYKILENIYDGKYGGKCSECNTSIAKLPAFDFHHPIKGLKTTPINFFGNWINKMTRLENEKTIPICRNCHLKKQSNVYGKFKEEIMKKNSFESNIKGIEKKIYQFLYKRKIKYRDAYQIKSWISKRIVIKRLYGGKCIQCDENDLSALQFHHRDKEKKTFPKYDKLRYTSIENIEKKLIKDDVVCLCGNCHRMIETEYYRKFHIKIADKRFSKDILKFYEDLNKNVENYKFPEKILNQYPLIDKENIEIGWKNKSLTYKLDSNEQQNKQELKDYKWENVSDNWILPSGQILDPTKESSRNNPLYKHKEWLKTVYNNKSWGLSDTSIARLTNTSQTTINYWRNKLQISTKKLSEKN